MTERHENELDAADAERLEVLNRIVSGLVKRRATLAGGHIQVLNGRTSIVGAVHPIQFADSEDESFTVSEAVSALAIAGLLEVEYDADGQTRISAGRKARKLFEMEGGDNGRER